MSTMIQLRNVPEEIHRKCKARAAMAGMSMSSYVIRELERILERPTQDEVLARIASRPKISLDVSAAEIIREERDSR